MNSFVKNRGFHTSTVCLLNKNPYDVLGVSKGSTSADIKKSYFQLAKKFHPDSFQSASEKEKAQAKEKFVEIQEAYEILSDDNKRKLYDTYGHVGDQNGGGFGAGGDPSAGWSNVDPSTAEEIFKSFFGRMGGMGGSGGSGGFGFPGFDDSMFNRGFAKEESRPNGDVTAKLSISFMDAVRGIKRMVGFHAWGKCRSCHGKGLNPGVTPKACSACKGTGQQSMSRGGFKLFITCQACGGVGSNISSNDICRSCSGEGRAKEYKETVVDIPAGVDSGERLKFQGLGHSGDEGRPGDLFIIVDVAKPGPSESIFSRKGSDLVIDVPVSVFQAITGDTIKVPTLDGNPATLNLPGGSQPNQRITIKGRGIQKFMQKPGVRGDLLVNLKVMVPKPDELRTEDLELVEKLKNSIQTGKVDFGGKQSGKDGIFRKTVNKLKETLFDDKK